MSFIQKWFDENYTVFDVFFENQYFSTIIKTAKLEKQIKLEQIFGCYTIVCNSNDNNNIRLTLFLCCIDVIRFFFFFFMTFSRTNFITFFLK